jgi:hypothetical protein
VTIKIDIPNKQLSEKILWFLNHFKNDGVEITTINHHDKPISQHSQALDRLEKIVSTKSKDSVVLDNAIIVNPHTELSRDIS